MRRLGLVTALVAAALLASGCKPRRMSTSDCEVVLDRITEIELAERGFRDPVLTAQRRREMRRRFGSELRACHERRVRENAMTCVLGAKSSEELSHRCLR